MQKKSDSSPNLRISSSQSTGLTSGQVAVMREKFHRNEFTPPARTAWWRQLLDKFDDPTIIILLVAAFLSLGVVAIERYVLGNPEASYLDTVGIFFAVALATIVGYLSERKSEKEFELLNRVKDDISVKVFRDGQITEVPIGDVVVGDRVYLELGDKIPADGVLFLANDLRIEQSMMTGESVPVRKRAFEGEIDLEDAQQLDELNRLGNDFFVARGTMVEEGHGVMCVLAVGDATQMGKIASALVDDPYRNETPLVAKLSRLARTISAWGATGAMLIFTLMSIQALAGSKLMDVEVLGRTNFGIVSCAALVLGFLLVQFGVLPFFRSLGLEMRSRLLRLFCVLPMVAVALSIGIGVTGMILDQGGSMQAGVDLLQAILLAFVVAVTIIVVAVPEGLPMMVTVSLALNMMKMARENCLVRKLVASETIGSATVICTDKTGTLTQNQMIPVWMLVGDQEFESKRLSRVPETPAWETLSRGIALNGRADLHIDTEPAESEKSGGKSGGKSGEKPKARGIGNPTECSLLKFLYRQDVDYRAIRAQYPLIGEVPHNSMRKLSLVIIRDGDTNVGYMKGAPERILERCSTIQIGGEVRDITGYRETIDRKIAEATGKALRVIALCERRGLDVRDPDSELGLEFAQDTQAWLDDRQYTLLAVVGIADPVREEVPEAVRRCADAGIQVKVITGDALPTALAIAEQTGIFHKDRPEEIAMTSEEFNRIPDAELPEKARNLRVLARSTPEDKYRLVRALHQAGEVVAMTGDGTNDAPALKYADVGLAMGITGTEVAKEASDIVILDDNFKSIVTGVWWGRTLSLNIQRFLQFQLSVNAVALICALVGPMVGVALPLTVTQLLWINIIMDTFAAIGYSTDPPRERTMRAAPSRRDEHIISPGMLMNILLISFFQSAMLFAALFCGWFLDAGSRYDRALSCSDPANLEALTVFFTMLIMFQFWHKFNCRALFRGESPFTLITKNHLFLWIVFTITVVQVVMVQLEPVGRFFRTTSLDPDQWLWITLVTATVIPVSFVFRLIVGCFHHR